jgi:hypothetical protein
MRRVLAALISCPLVALAAGCGASEPPRLDAACTASSTAIERALRRAPAPVTLRGGTRLSDCVSGARNGAELQDAGLVLTQAAEHLAARARGGDARAALALGYLVGAARRGAARTAGRQAELRRRVERSAAFLEAGRRVDAALERGLRAGEATG